MPLLMPPEKAVSWIHQDLTQKEIGGFLNFEILSKELHAHTVFSIRGQVSRPDGKAVNEYYNWGTAISGEQASLF